MRERVGLLAGLVVLSLGGLALGAWAAGDSTGHAAEMGASSLKAFIALLAVLALILGAAWAARRFLPFLPRNLPKGEQIQILSVRALGPRRSVHLVQIEGRRLLVGSTDTNIVLIKDLGGTP